MGEARRSIAARLGLVALNILLPGLAWFRLGHGRTGLLWMALLISEWLAILLLYAFGPEPGFAQFVVTVALLLAISVVTWLIPMIATWRASAMKRGGLPWWTRWYALLGLIIAMQLVAEGVVDMAHRYYKSFYAASESMAPTLLPGDKLLADMRPGAPVVRGAVLLFQAQGHIRIYRVAGLPGDRVAIRKGIPVINGRTAEQHFDAAVSYRDFDRPAIARRYEERLPGEAGSHAVFDLGYSPDLDEMAEFVVPPGRLFVLGDNRDRAADSRVPFDRNGVGLLPVDAVRGRALFFYWSTERAKIGVRINPDPDKADISPS